VSGEKDRKKKRKDTAEKILKRKAPPVCAEEGAGTENVYAHNGTPRKKGSHRVLPFEVRTTQLKGEEIEKEGQWGR